MSAQGQEGRRRARSRRAAGILVARRVARLLLALAAAVVVGVVIAVVVVPRVLGWVPLTILSGSMEPAIPVGSQVVVEPVRTEEEVARLRVGDVVTFMPYPDDPTLVTHRVVARTATADGTVELTTQGDANDAPDAGPLTATQIRGLVRYHVPYVGYAATFLDGAQKELAVTVLAVVLLGYAVWQLAAAGRARRGRHRGAHDGGARRRAGPAAPPAADALASPQDPGHAQQEARTQQEGGRLRR